MIRNRATQGADATSGAAASWAVTADDLERAISRQQSTARAVGRACFTAGSCSEAQQHCATARPIISQKYEGRSAAAVASRTTRPTSKSCRRTPTERIDPIHSTLGVLAAVRFLSKPW